MIESKTPYLCCSSGKVIVLKRVLALTPFVENNSKIENEVRSTDSKATVRCTLMKILQHFALQTESELRTYKTSPNYFYECQSFIQIAHNQYP